MSTPLGHVLFLDFSMGLVSLTFWFQLVHLLKQYVLALREHYSIAVQVSLRVLTVQLGSSLLSTSEEAALTDSLGPDGQQGSQAPQG
jgi:hypothetical protein